MIIFVSKIRNNWREALTEKLVLQCLIACLFISGLIVITQPSFYMFIEARHGVVLHDFLLNKISPANVSIPVFIIIWGMVCLGIVRCLITPHIFLNYMAG